MVHGLTSQNVSKYAELLLLLQLIARSGCHVVITKDTHAIGQTKKATTVTLTVSDFRPCLVLQAMAVCFLQDAFLQICLHTAC